ncbi:hypothetical protein QCA50_014743 [Cerrena zonata]|uniref:BTB domain-containing protein n=1 Tax=Cerrena zonata TaxID=2478898 RepID=A0AAW0FXR3_9APHY
MAPSLALPYHTRVARQRDEVSLLDENEMQYYTCLKHAFSALFTVVDYVTFPLSGDDIARLPQDRIGRSADGTYAACSAVFQGPILPLPIMGKVNDFWVCTVLGEEAIFYKGQEGWIRWSTSNFSDAVVRRGRVVRFSASDASPFSWYTKESTPETPLPVSIRLRNLMITTQTIRQHPQYLLDPLVAGTIDMSLTLLHYISGTPIEQACSGYTVAELKALCKSPDKTVFSVDDSQLSNEAAVPRHNSLPMIKDDSKYSSYCPSESAIESKPPVGVRPYSPRSQSSSSQITGLTPPDSTRNHEENNVSRKRPRDDSRMPISASPHNTLHFGSGIGPGTTSSRLSAMRSQSASRQNSAPLPITVPSSPRAPMNVSGDCGTLAMTHSTDQIPSNHHTDNDYDTEPQNKRARIEQQFAQTKPALVSYTSVAVETEAASPTPPETPLSDPVIRVQVENEVFELQLSNLVHHSAWFSRRFDNGGKRDTHIALTNVSAHDFGRLVGVLNRTFDFLASPPSPSVLSAILGASKALEFSTISDFLVQYMSTVWSSDCSLITEGRLEGAVVTIQLAREFRVPQLLRRAFYEIIRDGTDVTTLGLADKDTMTALKIQGLFQKEWMLFVKASPQTACDQGPSDSMTCSSRSIRKEQWTLNVTDSTIYELGMQDPLYALNRLIDLGWTKQGYCLSCAGHWRMGLRTKRAAWWDLLGSHVGEK